MLCLLHPIQDQRDQLGVELHLNRKVVAHAGHLDKARATSMRAVNGFSDRRTVGAAHNRVARAVNHQHWRIDFLPDFPKIEGLKLLVESSWPAVLTVRLVIPERLPLRMLADDLAGCLSLYQIEIVKL